jgi:hypothetical protein
LQPSCKADAVFQQRGFWAAKNTRLEASRDRYMKGRINDEIGALEVSLAQLGFGESYCAAIREKVAQGRDDAKALYQYKAALE